MIEVEVVEIFEPQIDELYIGIDDCEIIEVSFEIHVWNLIGEVVIDSDGYDDEDWYEFTLPAYHGLWARLDWSEDEGTEHLMFYQ